MKQIFIALSLGFLSVFAQQEPVINEHMTVNLVELDVKVQTLSGKYVSGLKQEEFKVYENGDLQDISHFEEVDLMRLPDEELEEYQSKVMILLDFQNSAHQDMRKIFDQLNKYFDTQYDGKSMIGIAINSGGIAEVLPFTNKVDRIKNALDVSKKLFGKALYKDNFFDRTVSSSMGGYFTANPNPNFRNIYRNELDQHQLDAYFRNQVEILGQFLNYVGTFTGKKSLIMISGPWGQGTITDNEGSVNDDSILSIRDIQTNCLFNKITINVISLDHSQADIDRHKIRRRRIGVFDRTVELASMSSGIFMKPANSMIFKSFGETVDTVGRYYRIRYYSQAKKDKYRKIKTKVKGFNRIVITQSGYFPGVKKVSNLKVQSDVNLTTQKNLQLQFKTDWMEWQKINRKEIGTNYAIGYRVYGDTGSLVAEHVKAGALVSKKGVFPTIKQNIELALEQNQNPVKVQIIVTDLTSGKKLLIDTLNTDI